MQCAHHGSVVDRDERREVAQVEHRVVSDDDVRAEDPPRQTDRVVALALAADLDRRAYLRQAFLRRWTSHASMAISPTANSSSQPVPEWL